MRRFAIIALAMTFGGCGLSMTEQRKYVTYAPASLWPNGSSAQPLPADVVAQGDLARHSAEATPPPASKELLERGQARFDIYCAPCHGLAGDGDGVIVAHGFPKPLSYHIDRLLAAPPGHFYDVITHGYRVMFCLRRSVDPHDRWAINGLYPCAPRSRRATEPKSPKRRGVLR